MKPIYTAPAIKITNVEMRPLMLGSIGGGEQNFSKGHNSFGIAVSGAKRKPKSLCSSNRKAFGMTNWQSY